MTFLRSSLAFLCLWSCASESAPLGAGDPTLTSSTETCVTCRDTRDGDSPDPSGTQTGGEGGELYCGEERPPWVVVDETSPIEGTFTGQLQLGSGAWATAQLTIAPRGPISARIYTADAGVAPACGDQRLTEVDWTLDMANLLQLSMNDSLVYSVQGRGALAASLDLPDPQVLATPPIPQDFRDAGDAPAPSAEAGGTTPEQGGTVQLAIHGQLSSATSVTLQLQWQCSECGTNRVGLPFADGTLTKQE